MVYTYKVEDYTRNSGPDFRVVEYKDGVWNNCFDGGWTKKQAEVQLKRIEAGLDYDEENDDLDGIC